MTSRKLFLFCLLVFYGCDNTNARLCDSCMPIRECEEALIFIMTEQNNTNYLKLKMIKARCEGLTFRNGKPSPKICCEDFYNVKHSCFTMPALDEEKNKTKIKENVNFETHENFKLLPEICGYSSYEETILVSVGGESAKQYELPWMALLSRMDNGKKIFHCGGSIINKKYVLTAAHCVKKHHIDGVRIGEYNLNTEEDCYGYGSFRVCERNLQNRHVEEIIIHENFTEMSPVNDIALIRLKKEIDFNFNNAAPICLPVFNDLIKMDLTSKTATASGWGQTEFQMQSPILMKVDIPIISNYDCKKIYYRYISDDETDVKFMCAGEKGKDTCKGDSGGPLVIEDVYNGTYRNIQFGLVSSGPHNCGSGEPGLYTDVRKYVKWILDHMRE